MEEWLVDWNNIDDGNVNVKMEIGAISGNNNRKLHMIVAKVRFL